MDRISTLGTMSDSRIMNLASDLMQDILPNIRPQKSNRPDLNLDILSVTGTKKGRLSGPYLKSNDKKWLTTFWTYSRIVC